MTKKAIIAIVTAMLLAGCLEPEPKPQPKYNDLPDVRHRPRHDIPLEP